MIPSHNWEWLGVFHCYTESHFLLNAAITNCTIQTQKPKLTSEPEPGVHHTCVIICQCYLICVICVSCIWKVLPSQTWSVPRESVNQCQSLNWWIFWSCLRFVPLSVLLSFIESLFKPGNHFAHIWAPLFLHWVKNVFIESFGREWDSFCSHMVNQCLIQWLC